jgi:hypothetical protein
MYVGPPLWSSGQSAWLQIQRSRFDSRRYQVFWEVVGLIRAQLSPVSTTVELLERKSSGSGLVSREYGHTDLSHWPRDTLYPQKLALTSPTSGNRSVGIGRSRTQATEFFFTCMCCSTSSLLGLWCFIAAEILRVLEGSSCCDVCAVHSAELCPAHPLQPGNQRHTRRHHKTRT